MLTSVRWHFLCTAWNNRNVHSSDYRAANDKHISGNHLHAVIPSRYLSESGSREIT